MTITTFICKQLEMLISRYDHCILTYLVNENLAMLNLLGRAEGYLKTHFHVKIIKGVQVRCFLFLNSLTFEKCCLWLIGVCLIK